MTHIDFVIPQPKLRDAVLRAWALHEEIFGGGGEFTCSVDCEIAPEAVYRRHNGADVIVSRGGTALGLKEQNPLTPVVEIPITTADMALSLRRAFRAYGELPTAVIGTKNMLSAVTHLGLKAPAEVRAYCTKTVRPEELHEAVLRAKADGCRLVVAGHNTCAFARQEGLQAGFIYSSVESVFLAITEAKRCAQVSWTERETSALFRGIVDHVSEGIISVDRQGRIRTFNPMAERMLGKRMAECVGGEPERALPESRLTALLRDGRACNNEIMRIGKTNYVVNCVPMGTAEDRQGLLVTLQAAGTYADVEGRLRERLRAKGYVAKYRFSGILGESPVILAAIRRAQRFSRVDSSVLLSGESGTGKELFAQSIHNDSNRSAGPFVAVNCATLPENLMESELFGYEGGAFTGASRQGKEGLFEAAHEGTLFLDEISEMPLHLQSRLLRVIQEREVRRVGGNRVIPVDVRLICSTNRDLPAMVAEGRFREDLYYRLNVLSVSLPALRERREDIPLILRHYVAHYADKFGKGEIALSQEACRLAEDYPWPGNIRELRNVCEQLAVLCEGGEITGADMEAALPRGGARRAPQPEGEPPDGAERRRIRDALNAAKSRGEAAEILGISRATLWRKCREYGIR